VCSTFVVNVRSSLCVIFKYICILFFRLEVYPSPGELPEFYMSFQRSSILPNAIFLFLTTLIRRFDKFTPNGSRNWHFQKIQGMLGLTVTFQHITICRRLHSLGRSDMGKFVERKRNWGDFEMVSWFFPYNLVLGLILWRIFIHHWYELVNLDRKTMLTNIIFFNFIDQM
jgi:hypothetical protein